MSEEYDTYDEREEAPKPEAAPEEKADPEPEKPEELSDEEFAALREQVRKMYNDQGPEELR